MSGPWEEFGGPTVEDVPPWVEFQKQDLAQQMQSARAEAATNQRKSFAEDVAGGALYTLSQMRPDLVARRLMGLPFEIDRALKLVPENAPNPVDQPLLQPEHVAAIREALRTPSAGLPADVSVLGPPAAEQAVNQFVNEQVSGMTTPANVAMLAAGAGGGVPGQAVARTFQAGMVGSLPDAVQNYVQARSRGDPVATWKAGLEVAATAGLPLAIEWGARGKEPAEIPAAPVPESAPATGPWQEFQEAPAEVQTSRPAAAPPAKPEPVTVPETPAEVRETGVDEIRRVGAKTIAQIQALWPDAQLNREQARGWRDLAWPKPAEQTREPGTPAAANVLPTSLVGEAAPLAPVTEKGANAEQITETTSSHGNVLNPRGESESAGQVSANESGAGISPRGQGETLRPPAQGAPEADVRSVGPPPGKEFSATTPVEGSEVRGGYDVVDAQDLVTSIKGTGDQAELLTKEGYNATALTKRVKNAILGALVGPENQALLNRLLEGAEELNLKNVANGVMSSAPGLMKFKGTPYDLSGTLHQALKDLVTIRSTGQRLYDFLTSKELFGDPHRTAESDILLKQLAEARSMKAVNEGLQAYVKQANEALQDAQSGGMFGDAAATQPQILERIYGRTEVTPAEEPSLSLGQSAASVTGRNQSSESQSANAAQRVQQSSSDIARGTPEAYSGQPGNPGAGAPRAQTPPDTLSPPSGPTTHSMAAGAGPALRTPRVLPNPNPIQPPARMPAAAKSHFSRFRQSFQSLFSPQNIDPTAKQFSFILRENNAQAALDLVRADAHLDELRGYFDRTPVPKDWQYDPNQPLPHNFAVMDALERDRTALPQPLQDWARAMDNEFAWRIDEVRKLKPGAMQQLIQNYFPHIWQNPGSTAVQSFMTEMGARTPFHGSKAFMRERSVPLIAEGLARGLRPISDNPVDLALAKLHQMDKFIMAARTLQEAKGNGMLKYYALGRRIPAGRTVVDDPAFTVYAPPVLEVKEAFDAGVRRGLIDFIQKMGWTHERVDRLGVNVWGQYATGKGEIASRFGGPDFVIMHEIGHGLEERYGLSRYLFSNDTLKREMSALADLRSKGVPSSKKFRTYAQTPDEQVANAIHGYLYAPEEMRRVAPNVQKIIYNIIREHPELEDLNEIKPGFALGTDATQLRLAGPVLAGHWTLPDGAAAVLRNHLSPSLSRWAPYRTLQAASNILNGAQLGWSAFHVGFTSLDATVSSVATALGYALRGELGKAAKTGALSAVAPVENYYRGKAVQQRMVRPGVSGVPILDFPRLGIKGFTWQPSASVDATLNSVAKLAVKGGLRAEMDPTWKTNITRNLLRAVHEGGLQNYIKAGMSLPWALVEQSIRPIAEFLVPRQKLGVFARLAEAEMDRLGPGATGDQVRAAMSRAADWTEDRMGQMTYDNLFMNRAVKAAAILGFRAYGWQLGKYRHIFGAASDAASLAKGLAERAAGKDTPIEITNRMLYPVALTMVAATVGGITNYLLSGQPPSELADYFFPRNGQTDDQGRPQRLMLPTYLKDLVSDWHDFPNLNKMGLSFYHKLNPWIATAADMWNNQDFYGVEIRHPDDPFAKQMADLSSFAAKQFMPFSLSGTMKLAEEKAPVSQLALPFFGIVPAKKALTMTPAETMAADIARASLPIGGRTREQYDHSQLLKTIVRDLRSNPPAGVQLDQAQLAGLRPGDEKSIVSMLTLKPLQYQVSKMTPEEAMRVWHLANEQERQLLQTQIGMKLANSRTLDPVKRTAYLQELMRGQGN